MKIIVRIKEEDWKKSFSAVVEIDDRFKTMFKQDFLQAHFTVAIAAAVFDIQHPTFGVLAHFMNQGMLEMKGCAAEGLAAALECHERRKKKSAFGESAEDQPIATSVPKKEESS